MARNEACVFLLAEGLHASFFILNKHQVLKNFFHPRLYISLSSLKRSYLELNNGRLFKPNQRTRKTTAKYFFPLKSQSHKKTPVYCNIYVCCFYKILPISILSLENSSSFMVTISFPSTAAFKAA